MDFAALESALPHVLPSVNGAPASMALLNLREAAREFCRRTLIWQEELAPVLTLVDVANYELPLPEKGALVKLLAYSYDGRDSLLATPAQGRGLALHGCGADVLWTDDLLTFNVNPVPKTAGKPIRVTVALQPAETSLEVPAFVLSQHVEAIAAGAIARIAALPAQNFSNDVVANAKGGQFERAVSREAMKVARGHGRTRTRAVGVFF